MADISVVVSRLIKPISSLQARIQVSERLKSLRVGESETLFHDSNNNNNTACSDRMRIANGHRSLARTSQP